MRNIVSRGLVLAALLPPFPYVANTQHNVAKSIQTNDPRLPILKKFLAENHCPIRKFASDFLEAADANDLDWRLLPSISIVESSGGKDYRNNNVFGWDSCKQNFPSVRDGIHIVASRLANSKLYRDKDVDSILRTYNPRPDYPARVKSVMRSISATPAPVANSLN